MNKRFFIFVEDPGALNMILDLPIFFEKNNFSYDITANASFILDEKKIKHFKLCNITQAINFLKSKKYHAFIIGTSENSQSLGLKLIKFGKENGIKTIGIVDMLTNARERFKGDSINPIEYEPDLLIVTDQPTKNAYINLGINSNNIFVCRHPQEDRIKNLKKIFQKKFSRKNSLSKRWLFIAENIDLFNPNEVLDRKTILFKVEEIQTGELE